MGLAARLRNAIMKRKDIVAVLSNLDYPVTMLVFYLVDVVGPHSIHNNKWVLLNGRIVG